MGDLIRKSVSPSEMFHPFHANNLISTNVERLAAKIDLLKSGDSSILSQVRHLVQSANAALTRGPYSVIQKTTLAPSGDIHDYWHVAPYWWPDPDKTRGLPYIKRDGRRVPGTRLNEPESAKFDRTRLQLMFDDTTVLALAWRMTGESRYAAHAANLVRTWFLDPKTRMNPHMIYSQVRLGHNNNRGNGTGIIEMKDVYYFLDAVREIDDSKEMSNAEIGELKQWLKTYFIWMRYSKEGAFESLRVNNHGTLYDLQVVAIAAYLDDLQTIESAFEKSKKRLAAQFESNGSQPQELARNISQHYCVFNLQIWSNLAFAFESCGFDLWHLSTRDGRSLERAFVWLLTHPENAWPYKQVSPFDAVRYAPLRYQASRVYGLESGADYSMLDPRRTKFSSYQGIQPYWSLCT